MSNIDKIEVAVAELSPVVDHAVNGVNQILARLDAQDAQDARVEAVAAQLRNLKDVLVSTFGAPEVPPVA